MPSGSAELCCVGIKDGKVTVATQPENIKEAIIKESITYKNVSYPVTSIGEEAFYDCESLTTLDLSTWDVSSLTNCEYMFRSCSNLETIYAGDWTSIVTPTSSANLFDWCQMLRGAVSYSSSRVSWAMANTNGYFTAKPTE